MSPVLITTMLNSFLLVVSSLSHDLHLWMSSNRLSLNSTQTQLIWFGTPEQLQELDIICFLLNSFPSLPSLRFSVRDLHVHVGVTLDSSLTFTLHFHPTSNSGASGPIAYLSVSLP